MRSTIKFALTAFIILSTFVLKAQTDAGDTYPKVRLNLTNAAGSKMKLLQFVGAKVVVVDSATLNNTNGSIELKGWPINEELQFQLVMQDKDQKMFVLYPVLDNHSVAEIYMDFSVIGGKDTYLDKFRYENSPSSVDWNNMMHFPAKWKKAKYGLETQFKSAITPTIKSEIDSLSNLIKDYRVALLKSTKSAATIYTGLNLLKFDYSDEDFGELLKDILGRFPQSEVVKNKVNWFIDTKNYIPPTGEVLAIGVQAVDFSFITDKGATQKLSSYKGNYILLDFWASWCKPCREESPFLKQAYLKYGKKGFKIVQVSIDNLSDEQKWRTAIVKDGTQPFVHTRKDKNDLLIKQYKVTAIPVNYLVDPSGKIVASNLRGEALDAKLKEIFR
ncbi:MAG: TlpA disulfide reductase family protein [Bacteroidota bacterium]